MTAELYRIALALKLSIVAEYVSPPTLIIHLSLQNGRTALMVASIAGNVQCVRMLLDKSAEVNMQDTVSGVMIHCVHAMQHIPRVPQ